MGFHEGGCGAIQMPEFLVQQQKKTVKSVESVPKGNATVSAQSSQPTMYQRAGEFLKGFSE